jgi:hypothetical protein
MRRFMPCCLVLALAACGPLSPGAALPPDAVYGSGDPTRTTILRNAHVFNAPAELAGRPAEAARALAGMEYLAAEIPVGPRWYEFQPQVTFALQRARVEWREALGISPDALPQPVVDSLFAVARGGGAEALPQALYPQPALTFARLGALPPLPRTALAAAETQQELSRVDFMGRTSPGGDSAGGRGQ